MNKALHTFTRVSLVFCLLSVTLSAQREREIKSVKSAQVEVKLGTNEFVQNLVLVFDELVALGASTEDLALIQATLGELTQLSDQEMASILTALESALNEPGAAGVDDNLNAALAGQAKVVNVLRQIFDRIRTRNLELTIASKAEALRRRQVENQHLTEMLDEGTGDAAEVQAEQRALEYEVNELVRELEAIQESAEQEGVAASPVDESVLEQLSELAAEATEQLEANQYSEAANTQQEIDEMLADLAAETGQELGPTEVVENLLEQLRSLLQRQVALGDGDANAIEAEQERLAVETELIRVPIENVNAPASVQVASAADNMRKVLGALSRESIVVSVDSQTATIEHLERAIELMEQTLEGMEDGEGDSGDGLEALVQMYEDANQLERQQGQQNDGEGSAGGQAQLARETAELQSEVLESSPEAARSLGRAAAGMAQALDPDMDEAERQQILDEAAEQLAAATEAILNEGRARRSEEQAGQGGGGLSQMELIVLEDNILGPSTLNPADRAAIEASRREPVSPEYAPLVEAYYDKLSRLSGTYD
jgi:hypothetical protein